MRARQTGYHINVYPDDSPSPFRKQACSMLWARQTGYHINVYPDNSPSPFRKQACSMLWARQTGCHINVYPDDSPSHIKAHIPLYCSRFLSAPLQLYPPSAKVGQRGKCPHCPVYQLYCFCPHFALVTNQFTPTFAFNAS